MITQRFSHTVFPAIAAVTLIGVASPTLAQRNRTLTLDAGTVIPVQLEEKLSSKENKKGDTFTAKIKVDKGDDYVGLPDGTIIEGRILTAKQKEGKDAGMLELGFQRLRMPSGQSFPIVGSLIGLDKKSVSRDSDGRIIAKPGSENKRVSYAGYGAGAAAIVGLLSNGKLNLSNLLLGGLLGYAAGSTQKASDNTRDVELKPGTEMGVRLDKKLTIKYTSELDGDESDLRYRRDNETDSGSRLDRRRDGQRDADISRDIDKPMANSSDEIGVMMGDNSLEFDSTAPPVMVENKVFVPLFPVLKSARIKYTTTSNGVTIMAPNSTVKINVGSKIVMDGNRRIRIDQAPRRMNGTTYVPAKVIEMATGYKSQWDSASNTLLLDK